MSTVLSDWHHELSLILSSLDDAPVECDGMTYAISYALDNAGIAHRCMMGYVKDHHTGSHVVPHLWVELADGSLIDFRLRLWLGDDDAVPHGIFTQDEYPDYEFVGEPKMRVNTLGAEVLNIMTDGLFSKVKITPDFVREQPSLLVLKERTAIPA